MALPLEEIAFTSIDGQPMTLGRFKGQVVLVVNVASKCGLTPQYQALQALYDRFKAQSFTIIGFPANDFAGQEPGTDAEIAQFCELNFAVTFPMTSKIVVTGAGKHPLYQALIETQPETKGDTDGFRQSLIKHGIAATQAPEVLWNFEKFLIGRDGSVAARFAPATTPDDPAVIAAIEAELAK